MNTEGTSSLPRGWAWADLGEVVSVIRGVTYRAGEARNRSGPGLLPIIRATNIDRSLTFEGLVYVPERRVKEEQLLRLGDIVVAASSGSKDIVGKGAPLTSPWTGSFGAFCYGVRPDSRLDFRFIGFFFQTGDYRRRVSELSAGVNINNLRRQHIEGARVPLAPVDEQCRIVAEIEKHLTRLDASVAALRRAQANLKRYRAAVLQAACEGRLVPTEAELARAEGREYEPANVLLDRILKERRAKRGEPPAPDASGLPELPEGWMWASLGQVFQVFVGATPSRARSEYWNGDIPWVSSGEVSFCTIRDTRERISDLGLRNSSTELHPPGTVLLGMIGEGRTRGQAAILGITACNNQNSAAIRVSEAGLPPEYIFRFLEGQYEQTRRIGSGNNQPALNKSRVQNIVFPLPPLAEQHRIVAEVERRLSLVDELELVVEHSLKRADRLRQAILKRAFEGKLAPQDPNDEPASVLLERIRAERAAQARPRNDRRARRAPRKQRTRKTADSPPARQTGAAA